MTAVSEERLAELKEFHRKAVEPRRLGDASAEWRARSDARDALVDAAPELLAEVERLRAIVNSYKVADEAGRPDHDCG